MYKGKGIIGKPIVSVDSGEVLYRVQDVLFDAAERHVLGFLVDEGGVLSAARVLPFSGVQVIGPDGILVPNSSSIVHAKDAANAKELLREDNVVVGTKVMTEDGKDLGSIVDIFFDESSGLIEGYEVSGGLFADAVSGKSYLPAPATFRIGRDVAFVPSETTDLIEGQAGGLEAMTARSQDSMRDAAAALQAKSGDLTDALKRAWEKAKGAAAEITGKTEDRVEEERIKGALGRPVTRVILAPDDQPILNTGELITNEAVAKARAAGVLDMLLSSVHKGDPDFTSEELKAKPQDEGLGASAASNA